MAVLLAGTIAGAQQEEIADQDLLNLLEEVEEDSGAQPVDTMDVGEADAAGTNVATVVDDLGMVEMDEVVGSTLDNLISVRLNRVSLEEAINLFAQLSGANIIVPELTEAAQISVNLKDVEWRPALQSILDTYNYELYQRVSGSNVYAVRRRPAGAPEPQVVETFVLKYATVPNAASLVEELLPENAKISQFASRNMLVVKSTESSLSEVRAVLETIDTVREQVFIESKFMELKDDAKKDLGIDWKVLQAYSLGTQGETTRSYTDTESSNREETRFTDINGKSYEESTASYEQFPVRPGGAPGLFPITGLTPTVKDMDSDVTTEILTSVLSADEFRLVLSALKENKGVDIVSNPKIIVANEEKANISIVEKEPNLKQERQQALNDTPDTITFTLDPELPFFSYGIELDVIPSINTSSNITVQINPSLTRKTGEKQAGENSYPMIAEKSIETVFNLASGQTAAIGGLTQVTENDTERKVPVLGSIPFIGRLFSWESTEQIQDETIIFVTVGLANTQNIDEETGMPEDAELARRQVIQDANLRKLREQGRIYFRAEEGDKLDDMMKVMHEEEAKRLERRKKALRKEAEKAAKKEARPAPVNNEVAAIK